VELAEVLRPRGKTPLVTGKSNNMTVTTIYLKEPNIYLAKYRQNQTNTKHGKYMSTRMLHDGILY